MTTDPAAPVPNPVQHRDAGVVIGILAILEGAIWAVARSAMRSTLGAGGAAP
jgi:hypothetical protein